MERWRDIPGYEGIYQASTHGRIRTCKSKTTESARHGTRTWKQRILKPKMARNKKGRIDPRVGLYRDKREKTFLVSRIVARTWVEGYAEELTVNHIDGNTCNNHVENLEWTTRGENIRDAFVNGLYSTCKRVRIVWPTGESKTFRSMADASRNIGKTAGYISNLISKGKTITPTGYKIMF